MSDSFFQRPRPPCCDPFPGLNLKFCGNVDSTYCATCGRWLEAPYDYIERADKHPAKCDGWTCRPDPICKCAHSLKAHGRSLRMRNLREIQTMLSEENQAALTRFTSGPHNCDECNCSEWEAIDPQ